MSTSIRIVVALALSLAAHPAHATDAALQRCLDRKAASDDFSGVIAATERGQTLASLMRGRLAGGGSAPITARTRFNLASASKMFTAVAVGQLIDGGKIRLDDKIGDVVKGLTPEASVVTVRQLLSHRSGLGDFFRPENMSAMMRARTASDLLKLIATDKPAFAPGTRFAYSNSGFVLLGILIERVSGLSYSAYLARYIFAPAGMTDTGPDPEPAAILATGMTALRPGMGPPGGPAAGIALIRPDGQGGPAGLHPAPGMALRGSPAGGFYGTEDDLQRFAQAFLDDRLTSAAMREALTAPQTEATPARAGLPARQYGFGFGVGRFGGRRWFGHNGGTPGTNTEFVVFPQDGLMLTVLANRDPPMASDMLAYLRALALDPALRAGCRTANPPVPVRKSLVE